MRRRAGVSKHRCSNQHMTRSAVVRAGPLHPIDANPPFAGSAISRNQCDCARKQLLNGLMMAFCIFARLSEAVKSRTTTLA